MQVVERYRIHSGAALYFVTYSIVDWLPVFVSEAAGKIVADSLAFCQAHKGLCINAFVIMPTHLHAIVFDSRFDSERLARALTDFRKFTGRQLCDFCRQRMPGCFDETFRSAAGDDRERRFWQPSRHPVQIESEPFWRVKLDYLHANPVRKGLVRRAIDWRFSSAAALLTDNLSLSDVPLAKIDW